MKIFKTIILVLLILLGASAGVAKIMLMPQEVEFLGGIGLSNALIIVFGLAQLVGGVLLIPKKTRLAGAILTALMLGISTVTIFMSGNMAFGAVSVFPILLASILILDSLKLNKESFLGSE